MRIFRTLEEVPEFRHAVLTIGTFDGVHKGHQKIIEHINKMAATRGGESVILTFHPHPRMLVNPHDTSLKLITTLEEKLNLLARYGVDNVVVVPFTRSFSQLSAEAYIHDFLLGQFHPELVVMAMIIVLEIIEPVTLTCCMRQPKMGLLKCLKLSNKW
jgi:cytidyltransferase-like protein